MVCLGVIWHNKSTHRFLAIEAETTDESKWLFKYSLLIWSTFLPNGGIFWILLSFAKILKISGDRLELLPSVILGLYNC